MALPNYIYRADARFVTLGPPTAAAAVCVHGFALADSDMARRWSPSGLTQFNVGRRADPGAAVLDAGVL